MTTYSAAPMPELGLELVRDVDAERIRSRLPRWDPRLWGDAQFSKNTRPGNRLLKLGLAWGRERVKARKLRQESLTPRSEESSVSCFTGKEEDVEVGLVYFGKRYLSPYLGRWISPDPLAVHVPGEADLNLYAYVKGAVLKAIDPLGLANNTGGAPSVADPNEPSAQESAPGTDDATRSDKVDAVAAVVGLGAAAVVGTACAMAPGPCSMAFATAAGLSTSGDQHVQMSAEEEATHKGALTIASMLVPGAARSVPRPATVEQQVARMSDGEVSKALDVVQQKIDTLAADPPAVGPVADAESMPQADTSAASTTASTNDAHNAASFERYKAGLAQLELADAEPVGKALKGTGPFSPRTFGRGLDIEHAAPTFARDMVSEGQHFTIRGYDGISKNLSQVSGEVNGQAGVFEYIVGPKGLEHQRFITGGGITGFPNQSIK